MTWSAASDSVGSTMTTSPPNKQILRYRDDRVRVFVDTEFYEDGTTIDLISIGACRSDGAEFYAVSREAKLDRVSEWVRENVVSQLPPASAPAWQTRAEIAAGFSRFLAGTGAAPVKSEVWGYYVSYDWVAICQLYGTMMGLPGHFPKFCMDLKQLSVMLGNPRHPKQESGEHNALADARWNRDVLFPFLRSLTSE